MAVAAAVGDMVVVAMVVAAVAAVIVVSFRFRSYYDGKLIKLLGGGSGGGAGGANAMPLGSRRW